MTILIVAIRERRGSVKSLIKRRASLAENPSRSPLMQSLGVHAHWLGRYPYIIYYRIVRDEVWIILGHVAREPWRGEIGRVVAVASAEGARYKVTRPCQKAGPFLRFD